MTPGEMSAPCRELLDEAIGILGGRAGAVFAVVPGARLELLSSCGPDDPADLVALERTALRALQTRGPVLGPSDATDRPGVPTSSPLTRTEHVALPALLGIEATAVLAVAIPSDGHGQLDERWVDRLAPVVRPLALGVDRVRIQAALDQRGDELTALRSQLDSFAVDFRSTYLAERDRSQQLAAALAELEETYRATVHGLAVAVEAKDEQTGGHLHRVRRYGMAVTALVAPDHANDPQFEYGFLLHDIGKLTVPDIVLTKNGPLTASEWELIRAHPQSGWSILEDIPFLAGAREIVLAHHERWDGGGYPQGLAREEIPLGAQIFPLCDAFDAMTSDRPYRQAMPLEAARAEIRQGSGTQFWPAAVEAFLTIATTELTVIRAETTDRAVQ